MGREPAPAAVAGGGGGRAFDLQDLTVDKVMELGTAAPERLRGALETLNEKPLGPNGRELSDAFDYGIGALVKNAVYIIGAVFVAWEIFINSPFFERKLPNIGAGLDDPTLVAPAPTGASNKLVVGLDELRPSPEPPGAEAAPESSPIESAVVPASPAPGPAPAAEDPPGDLPSVFSRLGKSKKPVE